MVLVPMLASVPCATDIALDVMWYQCQWHHITKQVMFHFMHFMFDIVYLSNAMMPLMIPFASCDCSTSGITQPKNHTTPHFNCIDIMNEMVPLKTPSELSDACASNNGVTWSKKSCCTSFYLSWPKECSGYIDDTISHMTLAPMASHDLKRFLISIVVT